jgi:hypothetical protein
MARGEAEFEAGFREASRKNPQLDWGAVRAMRPQPDSCIAVRPFADSPKNRRARGHHQGRKNRLPVFSTLQFNNMRLEEAVATGLDGGNLFIPISISIMGWSEFDHLRQFALACRPFLAHGFANSTA